VCGRRRRTEQCRSAGEWPVDLSFHTRRRSAKSGKTCGSLQTRLQTRAQRDLHTGRKVDRVSLQYVWPDPSVRSRGQEYSAVTFSPGKKQSRILPISLQGKRESLDVLFVAALSLSASAADPSRSTFRFAFGQHSSPGFVQVLPSTQYERQRGYGLLSASALESNGDSLC